MIDLLSKERSILERPFMEFRPFGLNDQGEKICDISGVIVQSNVDYLHDYLSRTGGDNAAREALDELCRLLNSRLPEGECGCRSFLGIHYRFPNLQLVYEYS